jgi:hypothetical protein
MGQADGNEDGERGAGRGGEGLGGWPKGKKGTRRGEGNRCWFLKI